MPSQHFVHVRAKASFKKAEKISTSQNVFTISIFIKHVREWTRKAFQGLTDCRLVKVEEATFPGPMVCSNNLKSENVGEPCQMRANPEAEMLFEWEKNTFQQTV